MSDDGDQGPFRDNARPPDPQPRWSYTAVASPILVTVGWLTCWYALSELEWLIYVGGLLLLAGGAAGAFGLIETKPRAVATEPREGDVPEVPAVPTYEGRSLAKLGLGCLLGPILLGCIGFGLLLLTCGGH